MKDLVVLAADKNMELLLRGLLSRVPDIERIAPFNFDVFVHPERDPGICNHAAAFLRPYIQKYRFALVLSDRIGSGQEVKTREDIERSIEHSLLVNGWENRATAIVIDPELENWIWVNESIIQQLLGWRNEQSLYNWLTENHWKEADAPKPLQPKEAFEKVLELTANPRSSSLYQKIASRASYRHCTDPAFLKMISAFRQWFGES